MKKVAQPNDAGFIVSNKAEDVVTAYSPVDEPAEEKVSKRTSKKAEAVAKEEEAPVAAEKVVAEPKVAEEEPAVEAE